MFAAVEEKGEHIFAYSLKTIKTVAILKLKSLKVTKKWVKVV